MKYWTTKDNQRIPICRMDDNHLINTIKFLERKAKEGICFLGWGSDNFDYDYDGCIYGEEALDYFEEYKYLVREAKKRKLI